MQASDKPMLVVVDELNGNKFARMVVHKGMESGGNDWLVVEAAEEIRSWGFTEGVGIILESDKENAILEVRETLIRYLGGLVTPKNPAEGESQPNGTVESAGKVVRDVMKVYKCQLEANVGPTGENSIIMQWMARWAAMAHNRYDGRPITMV